MRDQALWTWHILATGLIIVFLGLHMGIMHLDAILKVFNPAGGHPVDWANVAARTKSAGFMVTYIVLLGAALYHGFYGLRNILYELNPSRGIKQFISVVLLLVGFGLFAAGTWSAIVSFQRVQGL
jgi:succinate dehydrogenase hydrophobic anchor subunit